MNTYYKDKIFILHYYLAYQCWIIILENAFIPTLVFIIPLLSCYVLQLLLTLALTHKHTCKNSPSQHIRLESKITCRPKPPQGANEHFLGSSWNRYSYFESSYNQPCALEVHRIHATCHEWGARDTSLILRKSLAWERGNMRGSPETFSELARYTRPLEWFNFRGHVTRRLPYSEARYFATTQILESSCIRERGYGFASASGF